MTMAAAGVRYTPMIIGVHKRGVLVGNAPAERIQMCDEGKPNVLQSGLKQGPPR